jgi:hypothetical protein
MNQVYNNLSTTNENTASNVKTLMANERNEVFMSENSYQLGTNFQRTDCFCLHHQGLFTSLPDIEGRENLSILISLIASEDFTEM